MDKKIHKIEFFTDNPNVIAQWGLDAIDINDDGYFVDKNNVFIIQDNNKYYSINKDNYDADNKIFKEISKDNLYNDNGKWLNSLSDLTNKITINDETFRPIDKFNNPKVVCLVNEPKTLQVNGIKSNKELIIDSHASSLKIAEDINSISKQETISDNCYIKTAIGTDDNIYHIWGKETSSWVDLDDTTVLKDTKDMTEEELSNFNKLKDEIDEKGMTNEDFSVADMSYFLNKNIRFAHVIYTDSAVSNSILKEVDWNYKKLSGYIVLDSNDIKIDKLQNRYIEVTAINSDISKAKIEVLKNIKNDIDNGDNIEVNKLQMKLLMI